MPRTQNMSLIYKWTLPRKINFKVAPMTNQARKSKKNMKIMKHPSVTYRVSKKKVCRKSE